MERASSTLVLSRSNVLSLLDPDACIAAVEAAFRAESRGEVLAAGVLGTHADAGGFHVKAAGLIGDRAYYAAKVNANFPSNPKRHGLPTIQGLLSLFDASTGELLAIMDSTAITALRTAAATAVAARYLSRETSSVVTIVGCGVQGRNQLRALSRVRLIARVFAHDRDTNAQERFCDEMSSEMPCAVEGAPDVPSVARASDIVVTCTPSREPLLNEGDVQPGTFIAAVGADNEDKQEIAPDLLAGSAVVVDSLDQCAAIGDLHHAIAAGCMRREDVYASLGEIVGSQRVPPNDGRPVVFDSTGTALEDVAAAIVVYQRAMTRGVGYGVKLAS